MQFHEIIEAKVETESINNMINDNDAINKKDIKDNKRKRKINDDVNKNINKKR